MTIHAPKPLPTIIEVERRSGNRTLRVAFRDETPAETAVAVIWELREKQVFYEKVGRKRYMFNVEPNMNYGSLRDYLKSKEDEGLLWLYE